MCNLYRLHVPSNQLADAFGAVPGAANGVVMAKDYVAPGKPGQVVRVKDQRRVLDAMLWGFPFQGKPVTNVRNYRSPFWLSALANPARRCLVPVTEFQEWSVTPNPATGKKQAYWFGVPSQPIFAFAGIWRPTEREPVFSFLTCGYEGDPAHHVVGAIHPKACPVILHPEDYERWLTADIDDALSLACAFPSQLMAVRQ